MTKTIESTARLNELLAEGFFALQEVKDDIRDDPRSDPKPPTAYWHSPDGVANWNVRLGSNSGPYEKAALQMAEKLREAYNIEKPDGI